MGCHSRSWMIRIDIIGYSNDLRGVHQQGTRIGWPRLDSSFVYRAKQPGLGGEGRWRLWRMDILVTTSFSLLKIQGLAYGTTRRNRCSDSGSEAADEGQRPLGRLDADNWPTCFGYLDANLMEFNWTAWKCKVVFFPNGQLVTGLQEARHGFYFCSPASRCQPICKVPLIGSNASPPGWASTGGALGLPTRNRMVSYNQSCFEDGRSTCCQHLPWFAMPKRRWLTYLQVCASYFWQSNAPSKFRRLPGAETNQEVLPSQHGAT